MSDAPREAWLELRGVRKSYPQRGEVLRGLDLEAARGECLVLLGESGSGKTTTLRLLAGFDQPDAGLIRCGGQVWDDSMPPEKRRVAMVFQEAALYPHLNVRGNLEFGLGRIGGETERLLAEVIEHTAVGELMQRRPDQLSGGEKQRVSLARALSRNRPLLLCDEPLSQLDVGHRTELRRMLRDWQRRQGLTVVYVTHDQAEAMALADRLAILENGRVLECASPRKLYEDPDHLATARFLGSPAINVFKTEKREGQWRMPWGEAVSDQGIMVAVRPEDWRVCKTDGGVSCVVTGKEYAGHETVYTLRPTQARSDELRWRTNENGHALGASIPLAADWRRALRFHAANGLALRPK